MILDISHSRLAAKPLHICRNATKTFLTDYDHEVTKRAVFIEPSVMAQGIIVIEFD